MERYRLSNWSMQVEQLEEWKELLENMNNETVTSAIETITGQIDDILEQCK